MVKPNTVGRSCSDFPVQKSLENSRYVCMIRCFWNSNLKENNRSCFPTGSAFDMKVPTDPGLILNIRLLDFFLLFSHYSLVSFPSSPYSLHERYWYYLWPAIACSTTCFAAYHLVQSTRDTKALPSIHPPTPTTLTKVGWAIRHHPPSSVYH
jgi:hypothetical protein